MLLERLGVEVDLVAAVAGLLQRLLLGVQPLLVLDEAVVRLEALRAAAALEGQRAVPLPAVLHDVLGADVLGVAVGAVVDPRWVTIQFKYLDLGFGYKNGLKFNLYSVTCLN